MTQPLPHEPDRHLRLVPTGDEVRIPDATLLDAEQYLAVAARTHSYEPTEYGNAQRLAAVFGQDIRYVADQKQWLVWTGQRWTPDVNGELMRRAKAVARLIQFEATLVDPHLRDRWLRHARASETKRALQAMIDLAASEKIATEPGTPIVLTCQAADFDQDPMLLNCGNGTVDLRTGELRPHRREDMLRRLAPVDFRPAARSRPWDTFLDESTGGDRDLQRYLQLLAGATVLGTNDRDLIPVLSGPPASGKSTLIGAMQAALGTDYSTTANLDTFTERKASDAPREDVARLEGRRMVACVEGEHSHTLAVGLLKRMAGGDEITARALYQTSRTFRPEMTVWLVVNEPPRVPHDETGLWRRLKVIPFENQVTTIDPGLRGKLQHPDARAAVLNWMITGALRLTVIRGELPEPAAVVDSTREYREEQSATPIDAWLRESCRPAGDDVLTPIAELRESYERYCGDRGIAAISTKAWGAAMTRQFRKKRDASTRYYAGVELAPA